MSTKLVLSDKSIEEIKKLYCENNSLIEISRKMKVSRTVVTRVLREAELYEKKRQVRHLVTKKDLVDETVKIINYWNNGLSTEEISKIYKCNRSTIRDILIENNVDTKRKNYNLKKYNHDESYFDKIDTEEKAYWFGFIVADGHVSSSAVMVTLHSKDKEHLIKMKNALRSEAPITIKRKNNKVINEYSSDNEYCHLYICSAHICKTLKNYGVINRKSWEIDVEKILSNIPEDLIPHFIRGIFDGDGCIGIYKQCYYSNKPLYNFSIVGVENLMSFIKDYLGISAKLRFDKRTASTYILKCSKYSEIIKIRDILYSNATVYMDRKFEIFNQL